MSLLLLKLTVVSPGFLNIGSHRVFDWIPPPLPSHHGLDRMSQGEVPEPRVGLEETFFSKNLEMRRIREVRE